VIRTRVGYAGGTKENPTYRSLGDHSETIQIDYDPTQITYQDLLDLFWDSHNPTVRPWSRQYASIIFYHNEEQRQLALETKEREAARYGHEILTEIVPFSNFYRAEDYHQKYRLQQVPELIDAFHAIYPGTDEFVDSTATARVNGYLGGYGTLETVQSELENLGLSQASTQELLDILTGLRQ
jgi:peptide-methionine (S)-S-oxide reductase